MTEMLPSYTDRRDAIAQKLEPYFHISNLVPSNLAPTFEPAPGLRPNSLVCSWADPSTGENKLIVAISQVADAERKAASIREMITDEAPADPSKSLEDADAYEIGGQQPGEYVFVLSYVGRLTVLVGECWIDISPMPGAVPPNDVAQAALDIGRTVGCSSYVNDFQPPAIDTNRDVGAWTTADGLTYEPKTPPQR
jgi:hypothetical protein